MAPIQILIVAFSSLNNVHKLYVQWIGNLFCIVVHGEYNLPVTDLLAHTIRKTGISLGHEHIYCTVLTSLIRNKEHFFRNLHGAHT